MPNGIVIINTGDGKGKTTAALGLCMRAHGWGRRVCIIQFLKPPDFATGELMYCTANNLEIHTTGIGFTWNNTDKDTLLSLEKAWSLTIDKLNSNYDLVVLDEILGALNFKAIEKNPVFTEEDLIYALKQRHTAMDVVLTGRNASDALIAYADLVTEMKMVKHPYSKGVKAKKGIEY